MTSTLSALASAAFLASACSDAGAGAPEVLASSSEEATTTTTEPAPTVNLNIASGTFNLLCKGESSDADPGETYVLGPLAETDGETYVSVGLNTRSTRLCLDLVVEMLTGRFGFTPAVESLIGSSAPIDGAQSSESPDGMWRATWNVNSGPKLTLVVEKTS